MGICIQLRVTNVVHSCTPTLGSMHLSTLFFNPRPCRGSNICVTFYPLKFTQLSILPRSVKWVPAYMDHIKSVARCAYMCFRFAGGKLMIVMRLSAYSYGKGQYKCTTLLGILTCSVLWVCSALWPCCPVPWPWAVRNLAVKSSAALQHSDCCGHRKVYREFIQGFWASSQELQARKTEVQVAQRAS